jgi:catechol 2,3-dioxygenase-like lactoylglutathione lyase family enzyme
MIVPAGPSKSAETHIERKFPMITIKRLNHVGIRALDPARSAAFYVGVLGLEPHPTKKNWLRTKDKEFSVHLMPETERSTDRNDAADLARHFALESDDLEGVVDGLLAAGYKPFQSDLKAEHRKELTDSRDLTFGIGTIFVFDPDKNLVEFVDRTRGIFPEVLGQVP